MPAYVFSYVLIFNHLQVKLTDDGLMKIFLCFSRKQGFNFHANDQRNNVRNNLHEMPNPISRENISKCEASPAEREREREKERERERESNIVFIVLRYRIANH